MKHQERGTDMKTGIERFRQQKADNDKKIAAAAEKVNALKKTREELEARINYSIDAGDQVTAEKLIRNRIDVDVQLEIAQRTLSALDKPIDRAVVAEAWKEDLSDFQKQIEKSEKELQRIFRQAAEKALDIANLINASWDARYAALTTVDDQEPITYNAGNHDFPAVSFTAKDITNASELLTQDELNKIRPDAAGIISQATRDRSNIYFKRR